MCQLKMLTPKVITKLPKIGSRLNQLLPQSLQIALIRHTLNHMFAADSQNGSLNFLAGKIVQITVIDFAFSFRLHLKDSRLMVSANHEMGGAEPDLLIKASSVDFFLLCSAQVDPDTLFFQRRLSMIGDTELGLYLKNFLDSFDTQAKLPASLWRMQQYVATQLSSAVKI